MTQSTYLVPICFLYDPATGAMFPVPFSQLLEQWKRNQEQSEPAAEKEPIGFIRPKKDQAN